MKCWEGGPERLLLLSNIFSLREPRFRVPNFATLFDDRMPRSKIVLLFNTDKRTSHSKI